MRVLRLIVASALALAFVLAVAPVQAQNEACQFQSPMADGRSVLDHLVAAGDLDKKFTGLHQESPAHWPGVDTQGEVRSIFSNGGRVIFSGWDPAGGGWGVILDGVGPCADWRQAVWHMPDDPSSRLPQGSLVDGNTILGIHGHSGVDPQYGSHNHISVGLRGDTNPFTFTDGTEPRQVNGFWWIHSARLANGEALTLFAKDYSVHWEALNPWLYALVGVFIALLWIGLRAPGLKWGIWQAYVLAHQTVNGVLYGPRLSTRQAQRGGALFGCLLSLVVITLVALPLLVGVRVVINTDLNLNWRSIQLPVKLDWLSPRAATGGIASFFHPQVQRWSGDIVRWSSQDGRNLDPNLVATVVQIESCGWPDVTSGSGAAGLFQVMPFHFTSGEDMYDPETNSRRGLEYLQATLAAYPKDSARALAAYNGGIAGVASDNHDDWPAESRAYYRWGGGIYADAVRGATESPTLNEWLAAGGASLCAGQVGR